MKLISAAPSNTEVLFRLGVEDQILATTSLCDYPVGARRKQSIGGWSTNADLEKVLEKEPDKVFTSDRLQKDFREKLEEAGVKTVHVEPETLEEAYSSIERIGEEVDRSKEAEKLVQEMKKRISAVDLEGVKIYCEEWSDPPMVSGNWIPDLIEEANGQYMEVDGRSRETDAKEVESFDPDLIVLNICGAGEKADKTEVTERDGWEELGAVEKGNVFVVNDSLLNRPGPRLAEGVERLEEIVEDEMR